MTGTARELTRELPGPRTAALLTQVPTRLAADVHEVLVSAFVLAVLRWRPAGDGIEHDDPSVTVDLESHGREVPGTDLADTLGWFTALYPVRLRVCGLPDRIEPTDRPAVRALVGQVKEQLRGIPDRGIGFGLLRYLNESTAKALDGLPTPWFGFNYLGRFPAGAGPWQADRRFGVLTGHADPRLPLVHGIELNCFTADERQGPVLHAQWSWAGAQVSESSVAGLAAEWFDALGALTAAAEDDGDLRTPADFSSSSLTRHDLDAVRLQIGAQS